MKRIACFALAFLNLLGCGDDPKPGKGPALSATATEANSPPQSAPAAPSAEVFAGPVPKFDVVEAEFTESERSRDPFRLFSDIFKDEVKGQARSQRQVVLAQYAIDELKLIGIVTRVEPRAMLLDPVGTGHVVRRGQFVGRADIVQAAGRTGASYEINWRVDRIRDGDIVLIREDPANPDVPSATRVIPLRPEGTQVGGK